MEHFRAFFLYLFFSKGKNFHCFPQKVLGAPATLHSRLPCVYYWEVRHPERWAVLEQERVSRQCRNWAHACVPECVCIITVPCSRCRGSWTAGSHQCSTCTLTLLSPTSFPQSQLSPSLGSFRLCKPDITFSSSRVKRSRSHSFICLFLPTYRTKIQSLSVTELYPVPSS